MEQRRVRIPSITCGHCIATIKRELLDLEGVTSVGGDPQSREVTIQWNAPASWEGIVALLEEIGYPPVE